MAVAVAYVCDGPYILNAIKSPDHSIRIEPKDTAHRATGNSLEDSSKQHRMISIQSLKRVSLLVGVFSPVNRSLKRWVFRQDLMNGE